MPVTNASKQYVFNETASLRAVFFFFGRKWIFEFKSDLTRENISAILSERKRLTALEFAGALFWLQTAKFGICDPFDGANTGVHTYCRCK